MADQTISFAGEFEAATDEAWRALVERALAGRDFDKVMTSHTYDDIEIKGLYTAGNYRAEPRPAVRSGEWDVMTPHWNPNEAITNRAVLEDLARGATGVALRVEAGNAPGVPVAKLAEALDGVYLNMARFTLIPGEEYAEASEAMLSLLDAQAHDKNETQGCLGVDPLGTLAQTGRLKEKAETALEKAASIARKVEAAGYPVQALMADGTPYHMAGATEAQELGLLIATGVAYLRALTDAGMEVGTAAKHIGFTMAADADVSLTIAKFRAARLLWAAVLKECGIEGTMPMKLNAVSSMRMVSVKDPWVNILRITAACFGAGVAGADSICLLPHDCMLGMSSGFARRIARNVQIILQEESGLSRVADPAAGSYAFESLTSEVCDKAWKYFQKIESEGGLLAALRAGVVQTDMQASWSQRRINLAKRKDPITGVSEFPDIDEKPIVDVGEMPAIPRTLPAAGEEVDAVGFHRLAEDFEDLRHRSDACLKANGHRPSIYLANIGTAADFTARSTFAKNFFEAGGIKAVTGSGGVTESVFVDEYKASGAQLAVLCSSDDKYSEHAQGVAAALKKAGAHVFLAGRPLNAEELKAAGVEEFIYMGCDVLEVLTRAFDKAGEVA